MWRLKRKKTILFVIAIVLICGFAVRYKIVNNPETAPVVSTDTIKYGEPMEMDDLIYQIEKPDRVYCKDSSWGAPVYRYTIPFTAKNSFSQKTKVVHIIDKISLQSGGTVWYPYRPDVENSKMNKGTKWKLAPRQETKGNIVVEVVITSPYTAKVLDDYELYCVERYGGGSAYKVKLEE